MISIIDANINVRGSKTAIKGWGLRIAYSIVPINNPVKAIKNWIFLSPQTQTHMSYSKSLTIHEGIYCFIKGYCYYWEPV